MAAATGTEKSGEFKFMTVIYGSWIKLFGNPLDRLIGKIHSDPPNRSRSKDAVSKV